jgi:NAD(P)H-hydrate epimerase
VVAGSRNYVGAAYLASQGAARVGPGLVTLASPQSIYPILASKLTEVIHLPLPEDANGRFHPDAAGVLREVLHQYSSLLIGCGFGRSDGLVEFLRKLFFQEPYPSIPSVIDADGLNNLSEIEDWWRGLKSPLALTPHPGEMATLTGIPTPRIQARRNETALEWSAKWGVAVALKGAYTVVATPEGMCRISPFANPGLASGGTGDVLTGIIAGLMAQGLSPADAASCGVYLHGAAGEVVRQDMGDTGTLAGDLLPVLPGVIKRVKE